MALENAPQNPSERPSGTPVIPSESLGITEEAAASRISSILNPKPPRAADGKFQPKTPAEQAPPAVREPDTESEPEAAPEAEAPGEDDIEIEEGSDAEQSNAPSVDMPESWGKTTAEVWQSFTPDQQQFLKQHEAKRTQGITRQLNELKVEQEKVSQASKALEQQQLQIAQTAQRYADHTVKQFLTKFADLKSPEDVVNLSRDNPARYLEYDAALKAAQAAVHESRQHEESQRQSTLKQLQEFREAENAKLAEKLALTDEKAASAFEKSVTDYVSKAGIPTERLAQYRHEELIMADKARRWDAAVAKREEQRKAANPPPPVLRPGAPQVGRQVASQERDKQLSAKLRKSGSEADAAALLKARMFGGRRSR